VHLDAIGHVAGDNTVPRSEVQPDDIEAVGCEAVSDGRADAACGSGDNSDGHYAAPFVGYDVILDSDVCVSAGRCVAVAPGFFVFDADEISTLDAAGPRPDEESLLRIARSCPSGAIRLLRDGVDVDI